MVLFCPTCGNILLVEEGGGGYRFYCQTCPYIFPITSKVATTLQLPRKKVDDVMGEEAAWANAAREAGTPARRRRRSRSNPWCQQRAPSATTLRRSSSRHDVWSMYTSH